MNGQSNPTKPVDLSVASKVNTGDFVNATVTVTGATPKSAVTLRLEQERGAAGPPAVAEQTHTADDTGRAVGVFPLSFRAKGSFNVTASAREGGKSLGGDVKAVTADAAADDAPAVKLIMQRHAQAGAQVPATVKITGADAGADLSVSLSAEGGTVSPASPQLVRATAAGQAFAQFSVSIAAADSSLVTCDARDGGDTIGSDSMVVAVA